MQQDGRNSYRFSVDPGESVQIRVIPVETQGLVTAAFQGIALENVGGPDDLRFEFTAPSEPTLAPVALHFLFSPDAPPSACYELRLSVSPGQVFELPAVLRAKGDETSLVLTFAVGQSSAGAGPARRRPLYEGARGDEVRELQQRLTELGLFTDPLDGVFGPRTVQAVKDFQRGAGIPADGIVGPETEARLVKALADKRPGPDGTELSPSELESHVAQALERARQGRPDPITASQALDAILRTESSSVAFTALRQHLTELEASVPDVESGTTVPSTGFRLSPGLAAAVVLARAAVPDRRRLWGRALITAIVFGPEPLEGAFSKTMDPGWRPALEERWKDFLEKNEDGSAAWADAISQIRALAAASSTQPHAAGIAAVDPDRPSPDAVDHLGVENEAFAFARVAASHSVTPPLSIGVFGEWGSGKTFFMEKMRAHVSRLEASAQEAVKGAEPTAYHTAIVQIPFNAWHYMETNLWASLVDHIFRELDKWLRQHEKNEKQVDALYKRLSTSRMLKLEALEQLILARGRRQVAQQQVKAARHELAKTESEKDTITLAEFWKAAQDVFARDAPIAPSEQKKILGAARALGFVEVSDSAKELMEALKEARDQTQRGRIIARSVVSRLSRPAWTLPLIGLLILLPILSRPFVDWLVEKLSAGDLAASISSGAVAISGALAAASGWVGTAVAVGKSALGRLGSFQDSLDKALKDRKDSEPEPILQSEQILAQCRKEVALAETTLETATRELEEARSEFGDTAAARLNRFIRDKIVNGDYAKHLGIIASVRKDFERLAEIMSDIQSERDAASAYHGETQAYKAKIDSLNLQQLEEDGLLTREERQEIENEDSLPDDQLRFFQRIILYVDDLDRCPPKTVVEVLQACHLLLSFPLFIVVVAVDARWVSGALLNQYKGLLEFEPEANGASNPLRRDGGKSASPRDYLEKIFQVPYWVRRMQPEASQSYIEDLIGRVQGEGDTTPTPPPPPKPPPPKVPPVEGDVSAGTPPSDAGAGGAAPKPVPHGSGQGKAGTPAAGKPPPGPGGEPIDPNPASLALTRHERDFLAQLAPYAGDSPRTIKRFVNVYRILRTSLTDADLRVLVGENGESRVYRSIIAQLAIVTGAPTLADSYFAELGPQGLSDDRTPAALADVLRAQPHVAGSAEWKAIEGPLRALTAIDDSKEMLTEMRGRANVVKRYSFSARPYL